MKNFILKINALQQKLATLPVIDEVNSAKLSKKYRLEFNFNSNHLEGNTLTYGETELLLIFDQTDGTHQMRELEEMKAHDVAYQLIQKWALESEYPLTEQDIKELNNIILVQPFWKEAQTNDGQATRRLIKIGDYKEHPNSVRLQNGEMFHYATPAETPIKMGELMQWYKTELEKKELHPVELAALFHYKFVLIHPFDDGNGRISRLLMNYILLANNLPPVIIKSIDKQKYLYALNQADTGNIGAYVEYIAQQLLWSLELSIKATEGKSIDELGDLDKKLAIIKATKNIEDADFVKLSTESFTQLIETQLWHFFNALEITMAKFDAFFLSRNNFLFINYTNTERLDKISSARQILQTNRYKAGDNEINTIRLHSDFHANNIENQKISVLACDVTITFHPHQYAIISNAQQTPFYKLYNQEFKDEEIQTIVEAIGNHLIEHVISKM
jgi:Fic family protein